MPGKFEGEPDYTTYFWDFVLDGGGDETFYDIDGKPVDMFRLDETDYEEFPELEGDKYLVIWEDDNGFVNSQTFTSWTELRDFLVNSLWIDDNETDLSYYPGR